MTDIEHQLGLIWQALDEILKKLDERTQHHYIARPNESPEERSDRLRVDLERARMNNET